MFQGVCVSVYEGKKGTNVCKGKKDMKKISLWGKKKVKHLKKQW